MIAIDLSDIDDAPSQQADCAQPLDMHVASNDLNLSNHLSGVPQVGNHDTHKAATPTPQSGSTSPHFLVYAPSLISPELSETRPSASNASSSTSLQRSPITTRSTARRPATATAFGRTIRPLEKVSPKKTTLKSSTGSAVHGGHSSTSQNVFLASTMQPHSDAMDKSLLVPLQSTPQPVSLHGSPTPDQEQSHHHVIHNDTLLAKLKIRSEQLESLCRAAADRTRLAHEAFALRCQTDNDAFERAMHELSAQFGSGPVNSKSLLSPSVEKEKSAVLSQSVSPLRQRPSSVGRSPNSKAHSTARLATASITSPSSPYHSLHSRNYASLAASLTSPQKVHGSPIAESVAKDFNRTASALLKNSRS